MSSTMDQPKQVTVDYVSPGSMMALAICFLNISTIVVLLRIVSRRLQKSRIGPDDICIVLAWLATVAMCINMITAVAYKLWGAALPPVLDDTGTPVALNPGFSTSLEFSFIHEVIFPVQLTFTKLSILFCYLKLLCPEKRGCLYWASIAMIVITSLWGMSMFFTFLFQCGAKPYYYWSDYTLPGQCLPYGSIEESIAVSDAILDILIFLLPLWRLWTLHLPLKKRLLVITVFAVGSMSMVASLVRLGWFIPILTNPEGVYIDPNVLVSTFAYWEMVEAGFAITAVCLPSMKYLVDRLGKIIAARQDRLGSYVKSLHSSGASTPTAPRSPRSPAAWAKDGRKGLQDVEKGSVTDTTVTGSTEFIH